MEVLLSDRVPRAFTPSSTSERSTSLRCSFIHAIEGHTEGFDSNLLILLSVKEDVDL